MILGHGFTDLEEILLAATIVIVDEEAARIPVILRTIEHFELDKGCLAGLHCGVILILRTVLLLGDVLDDSQILDRGSTLASKEAREPATPVSLLIDLGKLDVVLEADSVLLHLFLQLLLLMLLAQVCIFSVKVIVAFFLD